MSSTAAPIADLPHDSLQPNIIACSVICWFLSAIFVALRFYARGRLIHALNSSDWCILVALVFACAASAGEIEEVVHGAGRHVWDMDPNDTYSQLAWARAGWYTILFYTLSLCFTKISILLLYIHIFTFQWVRCVGQLILAVVAITNVYMIAIIFTACIPLQAFWDLSITNKYCHAQSIWWSNTGLLMVTDFLIFLLPMPAVWILNLSKRQKYILVSIFGLGFFVCFISIIRLLYLIPVENNPNPDYLYSTAGLSYWTLVEFNGAIVCASMMTLKPLIVKIFPRFLILSSTGSGTMVGRDNWVSPPTIGSKPSNDMLGGRRRGHIRYKSSLEDFRENTDEEAGGIELGEVSSSQLANSSENGTDNPITTQLSPPPGAHLSTSHTKAFLDSASDTTDSELPSGNNSQPNVGRMGGSNLMFYDSASEKTDWGPEIREDSTGTA